MHFLKKYSLLLLGFVMTNALMSQSSFRIQAMQSLQNGDNLYRLGKWDEVLNYYNEAINIDKGFAEAYFKRAKLYKTMGRFKESQEDYERGVELNPMGEYAYNKRASLELLAVSYKANLDFFSNQETLTLGLKKERNTLIDDFILPDNFSFIETSKKIYSRLNDAKNDFLNDNYELAEQKIDSILIDDTLNVDALNFKGIILLKQNEYKEAITYFNKAKNVSGSYVYFFNKSIAQRLIGDIKEALKSLDTALMFNPNNQVLLFSRGVVNQNLNKFNEAKNDYEATLKLNPNHFNALYNKAYLLMLTGNYIDAMFLIDKLAKLNENDSDLWNLKGGIQILDGEYAHAVESFTQAISLNEFNNEAYYNRGLAYMMSYRPKQGCADFEYSLSKDFKEAQKAFDNFCGF